MAGLAASCVAVFLVAAVSCGGEVSVKTYRIGPGDKVDAATWPSALLMGVRKTDIDNPSATNIAVAFTNSRAKVAIKFAGREVTDKRGQKRYSGGFGWVPPRCNWYHDGFFWLDINGALSTVARFQLLEARGGDKGLARFVGELPDARVVADFVLLPDDNKLLLDLKVEPMEGKRLRRVTAYFSCYPSDFAVHAPGTRKRAVQTARRELRPTPGGGGRNANLTKDEPWVLFLDEHYDVASKRGSGPCALAFDASRVDLRVGCGSYRCLTTARWKPGVKRASFVLWDLSGMTNADAAAYMSSLQVTPEPANSAP